MASADEFYQQARSRWQQCIELSLYDDEEVVYPVTGLLKKGLKLDARHVPSLRLFSYLLAQIGATDESKEIIEQVLQLVPSDEKANELLTLIEKRDRNARLDWLFARWSAEEF